MCGRQAGQQRGSEVHNGGPNLAQMRVKDTPTLMGEQIALGSGVVW